MENLEELINIIKIKEDNEFYWILKSDKISIPNRYYTTKAQAYIALGILIHLYSQSDYIDFVEFEFILKATNRICSGKNWITE